MIVKMTKTAAGPSGTYSAGMTVHVDDELGQAWIDSGAAELASSPKPREIATAPAAPEKAAAPKPRRRRRKKVSDS